jgi:hypothetical protein
MQTDALIRALVADARPVRRLLPAARRCVLWLGGAFSLVSASLLLQGVRADLGARSRDGFFLLDNAALLAIFMLGARSAFRLSVPDQERLPSTLAAPLAACAGWLGLVLVQGALAPVFFEASARPGFLCIERVLTLGALPLGAAWAMLRAAAPERRGWTGFCAALSAFALGTFGMQLRCPIDRPVHVLLWHCVPMLLLGILGAGLGRAALTRRMGPVGSRAR